MPAGFANCIADDGEPFARAVGALPFQIRNMLGREARCEGAAQLVGGEAEFEGAGEVGDGPGADVVGFAPARG